MRAYGTLGATDAKEVYVCSPNLHGPGQTLTRKTGGRTENRESPSLRCRPGGGAQPLLRKKHEAGRDLSPLRNGGLKGLGEVQKMLLAWAQGETHCRWGRVKRKSFLTLADTVLGLDC